MTFAVINPMAFLYYNRFRQDILEQIVNPLTGARPLWIAQFSDVQPQLYWFTTNLCGDSARRWRCGDSPASSG